MVFVSGEEMNLTRRMFLKWAMVAAASPGPLLIEPKLISIPAVAVDAEVYGQIALATYPPWMADMETQGRVIGMALKEYFDACVAEQNLFVEKIRDAKLRRIVTP